MWNYEKRLEYPINIKRTDAEGKGQGGRFPGEQNRGRNAGIG